MLKRFSDFPARQHFRLNMAVSLAIVSVLDALEIPDISVKWPNDILSGPYKVCGILIENALQSGGIVHSIVGIGLNVNQRAFPGLPAASSLAVRSGRSLDTDQLLHGLQEALWKELSNLELMPSLEPQPSRVVPKEDDPLQDRYEARLYGKGVEAPFSTADRAPFAGVIQGVDADGRLLVATGDRVVRAYGFKEIRLHYGPEAR